MWACAHLPALSTIRAQHDLLYATRWQINMVDCVDACKSAGADVERRARKYADEDPTELPLLPLEEGQAEGTQKRMPTRQQQALAKLESALAELQKSLVRALSFRLPSCLGASRVLGVCVGA